MPRTAIVSRIRGAKMSNWTGRREETRSARLRNDNATRQRRRTSKTRSPIERVDEEMPVVSSGVGLGAGRNWWAEERIRGFCPRAVQRHWQAKPRERSKEASKSYRSSFVRPAWRLWLRRGRTERGARVVSCGLFRRGLTVSIGIAEPVLGFIALNERRAVPL